MKKTISIALFSLIGLTAQGQIVKESANRVFNYQMDTTTPLPEPSIEMGATADQVFNNLQRRYHGKVVLISFWATWGRGSVMAMNDLESLKDTKLNHPDLAFVNLTDQTSPIDKWQDKCKHIRGEHLRINEEQMNVLKQRFHIETLPFYILMDRQGRCRELPEAHIVDELLKELEKQ